MLAATRTPKRCKILFDLDPDLQAPLAVRLRRRDVPLGAYVRALFEAESAPSRERRRR